MLGHHSISEAPLGALVEEAAAPSGDIEPPVGSLTLQGLAPFVDPIPPAGALTFTGFAPEVDLPEARVTKTGAYVVKGDGPPRITKTGSYIVEGLATDRRITKTGSYAVETLGALCGAAPHLSVGNVTTNSAELLVDLLEEYIDVRYEIYDTDGNLVDFNVKSGTGRFVHVVAGLDPGTTYRAYARVRRACGWSPRSDEVEFTTLSSSLPDVDRGCPPEPRTWLQNPDTNPPRHNGTGFYKPLPGEPLRGEVECILRWTSAAQIWNIFISDDLGETWTLIEEDLEWALESDGDHYALYKFTIDTTLLPDGMDYRLRASSQIENDETVIDSVSFPIDNAEDVRWFRHNRDDLEDRFGRMWAETGGGYPGLPPGQIWARGPEGALAAVGRQDFSALADLTVPKCKSADAQMSFYIWSGEGGFFGLQGRDDTELSWAAIGFQMQGLTRADAEGIYVGAHNFISWPLGCCDDYLTSSTARVEASRPAASPTFFTVVGEDEDTSRIPSISKMFFKALANPVFARLDSNSPHLGWRNGPFPGDSARVDNQTCARRYEMYNVRARLVVDAVDDTLAQLSVRFDGPGVLLPESGYWHFDKQISLGQPAVEGAVGLVSRHVNNGSYGTPLGVRAFMTWSVLPLGEEGDPPDVPPTDPPDLPVGDPVIDLVVDCEELTATGAYPAEIAEDLDESRWRFYDLDENLIFDSGYQDDDFLTITFDLASDSIFEDYQGQAICGTVQFRDSSTGEETGESERDCVTIPKLLNQHEVVIDALTADSIRLTIRDILP